jgi:hypothetical protein
MANSTFAYAASGFLGGVVATGNVRTGLAGAFTSGFASAQFRRQQSREQDDFVVTNQTGGKFANGEITDSAREAMGGQGLPRTVVGIASPPSRSSYQSRLRIAQIAFSIRWALNIRHNPDDVLEYRDEYRFTPRSGGKDIACSARCEGYLNDPGSFPQTLGYYDAVTWNEPRVVLFRGAVEAMYDYAYFNSAASNAQPYFITNLSPLETAITVIAHESAHGMGYDLPPVDPSGYHPQAERFGYNAVARFRELLKIYSARNSGTGQ